MKSTTRLLFIGLMILLTCCVQPKEKKNDMKYSSAITFLYYDDFSYGIHFMEDVLQLSLVMDQGFARVYKVNEKAFLGIVQQKDKEAASGSTLFSLTTGNVESEYTRVKQLTVHNLTEIKHFESIPLRSFFFDDKEGHKFEIQQFLKEEDRISF
jgi:hypothetical protein